MKTITFYSYKGGVGRSLALVNMATRLSEFGKKVCLLDFDLEAPGLPLKFSPFLPKGGIKKGMVDYVTEFTTSGYLPEKITDYALELQRAESSASFFLIPAGNIDSSIYWKRLSSINWYDLLYENDNGIALFLHLKQQIKTQLQPDFLLVDSRTGISEMSAIPISLLADEVVIVAANNKENLEGAKRIIKAISNPENPVLEKAPKISFVLSRIPFSEKPEDKTKELILTKRILREYLLPMVQEINVIHSDRELELNEEIKIAYEKDENNVQSAKDYLLLFEKLMADDLTAEEIKKFGRVRKSMQLFQQAVEAGTNSEKIRLAREAIHLNPGNADYYRFIAAVYMECRELGNSLEALDKALGLNEYYLPALEARIEVLIQLEQYKEARIEIDKLLEVNRNSFPARQYLGQIYAKEGAPDKTLEVYTELLTLYPDSPQVYNMLAGAKRKSGDLNNALEFIYKSLELNADDGIAYATLAEINADKNNLNDFFIHLENALVRDLAAVKLIITTDPFYRKFYTNDRFLLLMKKYSIGLGEEIVDDSFR